MRKLLLALGVASLVLPASAQAHFNLTMPPSFAKSVEGGKGDAPCGPDTTAKEGTATVTPVTGGSLLMIHIDETTPHPGFYRFALSMTSPPVFPADNVVKDKSGVVLMPTSSGLSDTAAFEDPAKFPVLADHLFVHGDVGQQSFPSAAFPGQVTVPNMNCDKCTLQVIEFMSNHPSNGPSAGFFYHHCALLKITADPNKPIFDPNATGGTGGVGGGGASGAAGSSGAAGAATGGTGGTSGGGVGAGGASGSLGVSGGGASAAGAPAAGGASAGAAPAASGAAGAPVTSGADPGDGGGCSLGHRSSSSAPILALLVGLLALGRRRRARG